MELVMGIAFKLRREADAVFRTEGLTYPQYGVLLALAGREGLSQREVAEIVETDTTTVRVICDGLEAKAYLERRPDPLDRRVNRLAITSVGGEALARASAAIQPAMARILAAFGEDGAATIEPVLRQVYAAVLTLIQSKESS
jgi:DNA-binding MarR family transcriptional regulator